MSRLEQNGDVNVSATLNLNSTSVADENQMTSIADPALGMTDVCLLKTNRIITKTSLVSCHPSDCEAKQRENGRSLAEPESGEAGIPVGRAMRTVIATSDDRKTGIED